MRYIGSIFSLTSAQLAFIIALPIIVVVIALLVFLFFVVRRKRAKLYKENYYRKINDIVQYHDYFLLNQFPLKIEDHKKVFIDHIVLAEKYIYVISDFYFQGDIKGHASDESFILIGRNEKKTYIDNPILYNKKLLTKLAIATGFDVSLLKGICLVNDSCLLNIKNASKQFSILNRKDLKKYIKECEKDEVGVINQVQLEQAVKTLASFKKGN